MIKTMKEKGTTTVNPIYHWIDDDIWQYIRQEHIKTNPLYECGYHRVGCIGCPLANYKMRVKEFSDFPKYRDLYIRAFDKMLDVRNERKLDAQREWNNGRDVFDWWMEEYKHNVKGQMTLDDWLNSKED